MKNRKSNRRINWAAVNRKFTAYADSKPPAEVRHAPATQSKAIEELRKLYLQRPLE